MLLTHWPPQPQQDPHSTLKRKTSSSVMDGLQKKKKDIVLAYLMLYVVLAYLMLFAALSNAVCFYNVSFLPMISAIAFYFHVLSWFIDT